MTDSMEQTPRQTVMMLDEQDGERFLVTLSGRLGAADAEHLSQLLAKAVEKKPRFVIFDVRGLYTMPSICIGALISFRKSAIQHGTQVILAGPHAMMLEALTVLSLDKLFTITRDLNEAYALADAAVAAEWDTAG